MQVDPDVIAALEVVVAREPRNLPLLLHLAALLLDAGRPDEALKRCEAVLREAPADPAALELAAKATQLASGEGRRLRVLKGGAEEPA